jgi:hypothetical protein
LDDFGFAIAAVGEDILIGAPGAEAAYLFDGITYEIKHTFLNPGGPSGSDFGRSVAAFGDDVLIGAPAGEGGVGAVHLFDAQGGFLLFTIFNPNPAVGDDFGWSLATSSNKILVGAPGAEKVYMFEDLTIGEWGPVMDWPLFSIHGSVLPTGNVLLFQGQDSLPTATYVWNPATTLPTGPLPSRPPADIYCGGHASLADGRTFTAGGTGPPPPNFEGTRDANIFDPWALTWTPKTPMSGGRWYPTVTTLRDGRLLVTSGLLGDGSTYNEVPEVYDVADTWTPLTSAAKKVDLYPFMFLVPDGKVFFAGPAAILSTGERDPMSYTLDVATQTWTPVDASDIEGTSAAMYRPGKILKSGGPAPPFSGGERRAQVIDLTTAPSTWSEIPSMAFRRTDHNLVLLPDGKVLTVGGAVGGHPALAAADAVLSAEVWDPVSNTWGTMAAAAEPRMYHSIALLLPDGRVLSAGGQGVTTAQIYSPPYLQWGIEQPTITSMPTSAVIWGTTINVTYTPSTAVISSVVFLRPGSVTHGFDQNQRYVPANFTGGSGSLTVTVPPQRNLAPPGYYMLFLVTNAGVPSRAQFIQIDGPLVCG